MCNYEHMSGMTEASCKSSIKGVCCCHVQRPHILSSGIRHPFSEGPSLSEIVLVLVLDQSRLTRFVLYAMIGRRAVDDVLNNQDLICYILRFLVPAEGLCLRERCRISTVCRAWRHAVIQGVPAALHLGSTVKVEHIQAILENSRVLSNIRTVSKAVDSYGCLYASVIAKCSQRNFHARLANCKPDDCESGDESPARVFKIKHAQASERS